MLSLENGSFINRFRSKSCRGKAQIAKFPELVQFRWNKCFGSVDGSFDEFQRLRAEREIDPPLCAKEICDNGKCGASYISKEQRFSLLIDHTAMYFGDLKVRINLCVDLDDLVLASEAVDE